MILRTGAGVLTTAAVLGCVLGCSTSKDDVGKSGGSPPVTLIFANSDLDLAALPAVQRFLNRVEELSGGRITIDVHSAWGDGAPGYEPRVLRDVRRDKADLAWVGTRVFDKAGVRSFQALQAPLLVDSYALEKAVLRGPLPAKMLAGLKPIGLVGLAVLGDELRKPFGTKRFLVEPADYAGITFRTYDSAVQEHAVRALGARPTDIGWAGLREALLSGAVQGMETDLRSYAGNGYATAAPYMTANVNLWPRATALVMNASVFTALPKQEQRWLTQAAAEASAYALEHLGGDTSLVGEDCFRGARTKLASPHDVAVLQATFRPVYTAMERDPQTRSLIRSIESLKRSVQPERLDLPASCSTSGRATPPATTSARTTSFPEGVYRYRLTREDILKAVPAASEQLIRNNVGVATWKFFQGTHTWRQRPEYPTNSGTYGKGRYTVKGDVFVVRWSICKGCPPVETIHWRYDGRLLHLHKDTRDEGDIIVWNIKPLVKIR